MCHTCSSSHRNSGRTSKIIFPQRNQFIIFLFFCGEVERRKERLLQSDLFAEWSRKSFPNENCTSINRYKIQSPKTN